MSPSNVSQRILARASSVDEVVEMSSWVEADLFAAAESALESQVQEAARGLVHNRIIEAMRAADGSPHFTAEVQQNVVAIYVLCVSSPASVATLSAQQYAWAEAHPAARVWVLPCVVQHVRADVARIVADSVYEVRSLGHWATESRERQFLPPPHGLTHYLGGAALLKEHNLVREVANNGNRIYPYIEGVANYRHLPPALELRCSGDGDFPLMLVQTSGALNGALRVVRAGIYSAENPVNELEVYSMGTDVVELMDSRGGVYAAECAELVMFPSCLKVGMHLRWSVSLFADSFSFDSSQKPAMVQSEPSGTTIFSRIQSVKTIQLCGLCGYCLQVPVHAKQPDLLFNIYVFRPLLMGRVPRVGEFISAKGKLLAAPDSLVDTAVCWADSPETAQAAQEDEGTTLAPEEEAEATLPELLAAAFAEAGYSLEEAFAPLYRFGRPDFRFLSPTGTRLLVMVDTVVNGQVDKLGYRSRFYPDKYPAHMNRIPQGDGPADICFVTLHLDTEDGVKYALTAETFGTPVTLTLPQSICLAPSQPLNEQMAVELFADCMSTQDFTRILPYLREDLHYRSETANLEYFTKTDTLHHLRACFDNWRKHEVLNELSFVSQPIAYNGTSRVCCFAAQQGVGVSSTILTVKNGLICSILAVAPPSKNNESSSL